MTPTIKPTGCGECGMAVEPANAFHPYLYCELYKLGHHDPEAYLATYGVGRLDRLEQLEARLAGVLVQAEAARGAKTPEAFAAAVRFAINIAKEGA